MINLKRLKPALIITIILGLLITLATICDDDVLKIDLSCNLNYLAVTHCNSISDNALYTKFLTYNNNHPLSDKQFMVYVALQEKSPPKFVS